ncbi:histidine kinase-like ATPase [Choanephora cucurbitarum]|nr:histidine kinase-like ATPase [Choanephora cucurbitarum]
MTTIPSIKKLDQAVVNRIAAGEVIQRPANALKELIENSLDAGSTQIQILIKDGGLKLLQIQDNGHGIRKEDMGIVCERFTTSKLSKFEDLMGISTYGFRGEALASISHVAHVTITTKTAESPCAYRALYSDGQLTPARPGASAEPKACAGNNGTQITAEDLFYNVPTRRKALKSPSDEYNRILDIVSRYAVHNAGISFTCRKQGATMADVQTSTGATVVDTIRQLYGSSVASELLPVQQSLETLDVTVKGQITNANYSMKRMTLLLFINHRAVESSSIKRAIESVYSALLPKGGHPFVYLSLQMDPKNVDVNVHPTKKEVHFLHEERIVQALGDVFLKVLENANTSRTFYTQALLPGVSDPVVEQQEVSLNHRQNVPEYKYVRTDSRVTTLDAFVHSKSNPSCASLAGDKDETHLMEVSKPRVEVRLTSVLQLRKEIKKAENQDLTYILSNHTFIGCVDDALALIQHEQNIYIINYSAASEELMYQIVLNEFCNMGHIRFTEPISIRDCLRIAIDHEAQQGHLPATLKTPEAMIELITSMLISRADMLQEYFSLTLSPEGQLVAIPMLIRDYIPCMEKLPLFLLRLGTEVDWEHEKECFHTLSREIAIFYSAEPPMTDKEGYLWKVQHLVFPCFKTRFSAPTKLKTFVTQLANLADLYKIFERC